MTGIEHPQYKGPYPPDNPIAWAAFDKIVNGRAHELTGGEAIAYGGWREREQDAVQKAIYPPTFFTKDMITAGDIREGIRPGSIKFSGYVPDSKESDMTPLQSARAKLNDQSLGALTPEEMTALLSATEPAETRSSRLTWHLVDQILDITDEFPRDKSRPILYDIITERTSIHIDKVWGDEEMQKVVIGS